MTITTSCRTGDVAKVQKYLRFCSSAKREKILNHANPSTPLIIAVRYKHLHVVAHLLSWPELQIDYPASEGYTALCVAAWLDDTGLCVQLLEKKADPNCAYRSDGLAPLHIACRHGNEELVQLLIQNGADVNQQSKFLDTPLHYAVETKESIVTQLLLAGAKPQQKNFINRTPLLHALRLRKTGMLPLLAPLCDLDTLRDCRNRGYAEIDEFIVEVHNDTLFAFLTPICLNQRAGIKRNKYDVWRDRLLDPRVFSIVSSYL